MTGTDATRALAAAAAPGTTLAAGTVIDEWRVERHIATGGFGAVYEVAHVAHGLRGALKQLHGHLVTSSEMIARLIREAHTIARLRHPNIVELLASGTDAGGAPYLVMELLHGRDLASVIAARGRLPAAEVLELLEPLCAAVARSHEHGVIHRDIKASNVMVCGEGAARRVVLLDFGIAKVLDAATDLTASRQALGTPTSMAPEQIRGETVDVRADVYALGALAFHLLTGRRPFEDASMTMSQYMHLHAARPRASASAPVSPPIDEVVTRAMAIEPAHRHPDVLAFFAALRGAVSGDGRPPAATADAYGVLVRIGGGDDDADDALLDDRDRAFDAAERALLARGFVFARDLGEALLFVRAGEAAEVDAAVREVERAIAARPGADPRVKVRLVLHRAALASAEGRPVGGPLLDPAGWGLPDDDEGVWIGGGGGGFVRVG